MKTSLFVENIIMRDCLWWDLGHTKWVIVFGVGWVGSFGRRWSLVGSGHEMGDHVDRQRKNDGRVLLGADASQCLQIPKLQKKWRKVENKKKFKIIKPKKKRKKLGMIWQHGRLVSKNDCFVIIVIFVKNLTIEKPTVQVKEQNVWNSNSILFDNKRRLPSAARDYVTISLWNSPV